MAKLASIVVLMGVIAAGANAGKAEVELDSCNPAAPHSGCCCLMGNCQRIDPLTQRCCRVRRGMAVCAKEQECGGESWDTHAYCVNVTTTTVVTTTAGMEAISISSSTTLLHSGEQTSWTTSATTTLTSVQSMTETSGTRLDFDEAITSTASDWTTSGHAVVLCMLVLLSALTQ
mmetsp:Transcript_43770/g.75870  ORF Transcript_43770/g.75870 Transcript_43770/m.75870 type:complete len:174 (+) Transcript_43770:68-589(+)